MKQLFNYTLLRLKAYIPNPKGCTQNPIRVRSGLKWQNKIKKEKRKKRGK